MIDPNELRIGNYVKTEIQYSDGAQKFVGCAIVKGISDEGVNFNIHIAV